MTEQLTSSLGRFIDNSHSEFMLAAAAQLLEMLEGDEVEPISAPGDPITAEDIAERLEHKLERLRTRDESIQGMGLIEDAVAHLRNHDGGALEPWSYEDGEGIRWVVLSDGSEDVVACYSSQPFLEADI